MNEALIPELRSEDIIVMDNLRSHKANGIWEAIEGIGAWVAYLSPYNPDLNPIENAFECEELSAFVESQS